MLKISKHLGQFGISANYSYNFYLKHQQPYPKYYENSNQRSVFNVVKNYYYHYDYPNAYDYYYYEANIEDNIDTQIRNKATFTTNTCQTIYMLYFFSYVLWN